MDGKTSSGNFKRQRNRLELRTKAQFIIWWRCFWQTTRFSKTTMVLRFSLKMLYLLYSHSLQLHYSKSGIFLFSSFADSREVGSLCTPLNLSHFVLINSEIILRPSSLPKISLTLCLIFIASFISLISLWINLFASFT